MGLTSTRTTSSRHLWSVIWLAQVPPKIRLFMWRTYLNILPTRTNLFDKEILHSFSCQWCEDEPETLSHVLWQCDFARRIWYAYPIPISSVCTVDMSFWDFISHCITDLSASLVTVLFTTVWEIWNARNRLLWDNKNSTVDDIWQCAAGVAIDFMEAGLQVPDPGGEFVVLVFNRWRPPELGNYKVNLGFCLNLSSKVVGVGFLVCGSRGLMMVAMQRNFALCNDKLQLQAMVESD